MTSLEPDITEQARKKRTIWLMAGGAASLLLPLLGVFYMHWSSLSGGQGPSGRNDVFERRDGGDKRITPSQTAVPGPGLMSPQAALPPVGRTESSGGSSLDFIKPGQEMAGKTPDPSKAAPAPAAPAAVAPAAPAAPAEPPAAAAKTKAKKGKKEFSMPKLQPSRGFTNFGSGKGGSTKGGAAAPQGGNSGGGAQDMLNNLPPDAANNPQLQQYLKQQQGK
ncbi:MAG: hypothetical protein ACHQ51_01875 [Elusimicrobiota bacterium]